MKRVINFARNMEKILKDKKIAKSNSLCYAAFKTILFSKLSVCEIVH